MTIINKNLDKKYIKVKKYGIQSKKGLWQFIQTEFQTDKTSIDSLSLVYENDYKLATEINKNFSSFQLNTTSTFNNHSKIPNYAFNFSISTVNEAIYKIQTNKATGSDNIPGVTVYLAPCKFGPAGQYLLGNLVRPGNIS